MQAMFIPTLDEAHDTSYFMSRYMWNAEDDQVHEGSDFDDMTDTCSSGSLSNLQDEDVSAHFNIFFFWLDAYIFTEGATLYL